MTLRGGEGSGAREFRDGSLKTEHQQCGNIVDRWPPQSQNLCFPEKKRMKEGTRMKGVSPSTNHNVVVDRKTPVFTSDGTYRERNDKEE